ncbi:O-antigen ligase family protein [Opitutales bacterium]|nr:O-antigen ligase family protein [Opitutales bacterium]MDA9589172.1 O-antigen ligase family protein [Opitutales bacterium]MDB2358325.1 O-antigen ligase family protein [Opitutales bacterium]MDB2681956.1 O-antigen ligase family protein [Opitutales bacterium]
MRAPSVAPREWAVVLTGALTLAFTAWGLAGVQLWSLHTLLAGGLLTFLFSIAPLPERFNGTDGEHGNRKNMHRLLRFPVFWLGLAFLLYITLQGLNPAWEQVRDERGWWVEEVEAVSWLPTGVDSSYVPMNAFRVLVSFAAMFTLVWGLWVGVRRRSSAVLLLWSLVISGVGMGIIAILQKFSGADAVLWSVKSSNANFWGTFFYRNEAVAYLNVVICACAVLYFYHLNRGEQRGRSGGPHLLLFVFVAVLYTSIGLALSRGGILFGGVMTVCFFIATAGRWLFSTSKRNSIVLSLVVGALMLGGGSMMFQYVDVEDIEQRFGDIEETIMTADEDSRAITTKVTWEMAQEELWLGWGAGTWRYIFPMYQKSYPEIYYVRYHPRKGWLGRKVYHYAHNDIVQFLCEYGIVGCGFLLLTFGYWVWCLLFRASGNAMSALMLLIGMAVAFGHAFVDFIFQSPVYWLALNGLLCVSVKLLSLHSQRLYR